MGEFSSLERLEDSNLLCFRYSVHPSLYLFFFIIPRIEHSSFISFTGQKKKDKLVIEQSADIQQIHE